MRKLDFIHFLEVLHAMKKVDLSSSSAIKATIKKYEELAYKKGGNEYVSILKKYNIANPENFEDMFYNEDFVNMLENDRLGKKILSTVIYKKRQDMKREAEAVEKLYGDFMSEDINDVEDYDNTYVLREQNGEGPVVFVELHNMKDINKIKTWYAYRYGVNYMKVSPCSFKFWIEHEDRQNFSNKDMVRQYRDDKTREQAMEADMITEDYNHISFEKGDTVKDEKEYEYKVIDVFTTEAEVEKAKKRRPYRVIIPKTYEISEDTPVVAVITINAPNRGLNFIYPISKFSTVSNYLDENITAASEDSYDSYVLIDNSDYAVIGNYNDFIEAKYDADYFAHRNVHGSYSVCGCVNDVYECDPEAEDNTIVYTADFKFVR